MGKTSKSNTTPKKEPHRKAVPEVPSFQSAMIEMAWRIALPFMVLSLGGIKLDETLETEPLYSIIGVVLAVVVVGVIVYRFVNDNFPGTFGGNK